MPTPGNTIRDPLADQYEEYIVFQCPMCQTAVSDEDISCPGCGAIFVSSGDEAKDPGLASGELEVGYELDDDIDLTDLDEDALEAEIAAMEADLDDGPLQDDSDSDPFDLDLSYEEDLAEEEEVEQAFGRAVKVSADDHAALENMSKPTLMERLFQRAGLGMFIAGGIGTVLVILWDPINGNPINLGETQWRFLVLALSMFIVGFVIEMLHAYSLASSDDDLLQQGHIEG
jgi:preprotein translocase subunit Sss1